MAGDALFGWQGFRCDAASGTLGVLRLTALAGIRRVYVDQSLVVMAIGQRIGAAAVNSGVNFSEK